MFIVLGQSDSMSEMQYADLASIFAYIYASQSPPVQRQKCHNLYTLLLPPIPHYLSRPLPLPIRLPNRINQPPSQNVNRT